MSHEDNVISVDANVDTTTSMEPVAIHNVADTPSVVVPKPKKLKVGPLAEV